MCVGAACAVCAECAVVGFCESARGERATVSEALKRLDKQHLAQAALMDSLGIPREMLRIPLEMGPRRILWQGVAVGYPHERVGYLSTGFPFLYKSLAGPNQVISNKEPSLSRRHAPLPCAAVLTSDVGVRPPLGRQTALRAGGQKGRRFRDALGLRGSDDVLLRGGASKRVEMLLGSEVAGQPPGSVNLEGGGECRNPSKGDLAFAMFLGSARVDVHATFVHMLTENSGRQGSNRDTGTIQHARN